MFGMFRSPSQMESGAGANGRSVFLVALLLPLVAAACQYASPPEAADTVVYGDPVSLGEGTARTYVVMRSGQPAEVGVSMSAEVARGLPTDHDPTGILMPDGHRTFEYVLSMPAEHETPFQHVTVDWNPAGHEPTGVYYVPHFDIHFYTISNADRMAISPDDPLFVEKAGRHPPSEQIPEGYVAVSDGVPLMGVHWASREAPELNGMPFTHTLLAGSWDGRLIFLEPMVTLAFLESRPDFLDGLSMPRTYPGPGRYPTTYGIRWDERASEYRISLGGLVEVAWPTG